MPPTISIHYRRDNFKYDLQVKLIITTFLIGLIVFLFIRTWLAAGVLFLMLTLEYLWYRIPDGKVELSKYNGKWWVRQIEKDSIRDSELLSHQFSWHYVSMGGSSMYRTGSPKKSSHRNYVVLKMELLLQHHRQLALTYELYAWQETPRGWPYKLLLPPKNGEILIAGKRLTKIKAMLENPMFAKQLS